VHALAQFIAGEIEQAALALEPFAEGGQRMRVV
jgi:hypothetical protein